MDSGAPGEFSASASSPGRSGRGLLATRRARITTFAAIGVVVVVGGGAFAIAEAFSSSGPKPAAAATTTHRPPVRPSRNPGSFGTVRSIAANSFVLAPSTGSTVTVDVTSATKYTDRGVASPSFADVKVGAEVAVQGSEASGVMHATSVLIGGARPSGGFAGRGFGGAGAPGAFGTVKSVSGSGFTVSSRTGSTVDVSVASSTKYTDRGVSSPSFADVKVGVFVAVEGATSGGTLKATSVAIITGFGGGGFGGGGFGGGGGGFSGGAPT